MSRPRLRDSPPFAALAQDILDHLLHLRPPVTDTWSV